MLSYDWDPHQWMQKEKLKAGGLVARADQHSGIPKGQGTASKGDKSWWKYLPQKVLVRPLNSTPPRSRSPRSPDPFPPFKSFEASEGHRGNSRQMKEETEALDLAWCDVRLLTAEQQKTEKWDNRRGGADREVADRIQASVTTLREK